MTTNNPIPPSQSNSQPFSFNDAGVVEFYQGPVIVDDNLTVQGNLTVDGIIDGGTVVYDDVTVSGTLTVESGGGALVVDGIATFDDVTVTNVLTVDDVTVSGNVTVSGTLAAHDVTVSSTVALEDGATVTGAGLVVGSPTSGGLGSGTINAVAIYVNAVPVLTSLSSYATLPATTISIFTVSNTSPLMAGLGTTWTIEPKTSGKILVTLQGYIVPITGSNTFAYQLFVGTGTPPAKGATVTGTSYGAQLAADATAAGVPLPITITMIVAGLTVGTTYWFDLAANASNATDTISVEGVTVSLGEMP